MNGICSRIDHAESHWPLLRMCALVHVCRVYCDCDRHITIKRAPVQWICARAVCVPTHRSHSGAHTRPETIFPCCCLIVPFIVAELWPITHISRISISISIDACVAPAVIMNVCFANGRLFEFDLVVVSVSAAIGVCARATETQTN